MTRRRDPVTRFLASPRLALVLLIFAGVWSLLATVVPQGGLDSPAVSEWAERWGVLASITGLLGLHDAFAAPVFMGVAIILTISTAVCSWDRTRVAIARSKALRSAGGMDRTQLAAIHDIAIPLQPGLSEAEVLHKTAAALETLGIDTVEHDGVLRSVSPPWSVWGSPIFHWSLVVLALAAFGGVLVRAEGSMVIPVGGTKADQESSYLFVSEGPLHSWDGVSRSIRVDDFEPLVMKGDMELGAVPTVSVLDEDGTALVTQPVYPNNKLHAGSLSVSAPDCGLTLTFQLVSPTGTELPPVQQLVDFSQESTAGTLPTAPLALSASTGEVLLRLNAVVLLDRQEDGSFGEWIPEEPSAELWLIDGSGIPLYEGPIALGETVGLVGGGSVSLVDVGWHSRLSLVDDPSIPFVYASMIAAMLGLTLSLVSKQQLVAVTVAEGKDRPELLVNLRLWRNAVTDRNDVVRELTNALGIENAEDSE